MLDKYFHCTNEKLLDAWPDNSSQQHSILYRILIIPHPASDFREPARFVKPPGHRIRVANLKVQRCAPAVCGFRDGSVQELAADSLSLRHRQDC